MWPGFRFYNIYFAHRAKRAAAALDAPLVLKKFFIENWHKETWFKANCGC